MDPRLRLAGTMLVAALGGGLATLAGMPASWLSGAMVAVTAASLAGWDTRLPLPIVELAFLLIGTALGSGVTPELLNGALAWPLSLLGLATTVAACIVAVRVFLVRVAGWDRDTAFFSAVPGALSFVLALASETSADMRKVAASQSIRIFLLVAVLPGLIVAVEPNPPAPVILPGAPLAHIVLMILGAAVVGLLFRRLGVPAGLLTGSFLASAFLHGSGLVTGALPTPLVVIAFILLGALVGSRFAGTTLRFVAGILVASVGAFLVATTIAALMAIAIAEIIGVPIDQAIVAYAPGGLDAMMSLSLALHMDTAFVAAHQFARFAGIAIVLPFIVPKRGPVVPVDIGGEED
ncbi:MAG: AbrB family transcriptional regulator [Bauldia sp.]|nr:AbrB family transcriptional regulator [Bauldia sp.]